MLPKRYGESKVSQCVFCPHAAYANNAQRLPVCKDHKDETLGEVVCFCKESLEIKQGKFGPFLLCPNCGPIGLAKAADLIAAARKKAADKAPRPHLPKPRDDFIASREETINPDDPRYFS